MLCNNYALIRTYYVGVIAMIAGYWTALITIMLIILLLTGWGNWINKRLKLVILLPVTVIVWVAAYKEWNWQVAPGYGTLTVNMSFAAVCLILLLYGVLGSPRLELQLVLLYTAVLGLAMTMIRAFAMFAPWAGASIAYWHLPLLSGLLLGLLQLSFAELALVVFCGMGLAEPLLMWQQRGEYNGAIAGLQWWDGIVLALLGTAIVKISVALLQKFTLSIVQMLGKRMKS